MPATASKSSKPRAKSATKAATIRHAPVPKPAKPYPGYMTDEWFKYLDDRMARLTKAEVRATLIRAGIKDKDGKFTAPYRNG